MTHSTHDPHDWWPLWLINCDPWPTWPVTTWPVIYVIHDHDRLTTGSSDSRIEVAITWRCVVLLKRVVCLCGRTCLVVPVYGRTCLWSYLSMIVPVCDRALQDELRTWNSQVRTGQPSIFAIQVWRTAYCITMYYKTDQHNSSSCKGTFGLLYFMGTNTMIFAVFKGWHMTPLHCVTNW